MRPPIERSTFARQLVHHGSAMASQLGLPQGPRLSRHANMAWDSSTSQISSLTRIRPA